MAAKIEQLATTLFSDGKIDGLEASAFSAAFLFASENRKSFAEEYGTKALSVVDELVKGIPTS